MMHPVKQIAGAKRTITGLPRGRPARLAEPAARIEQRTAQRRILYIHHGSGTGGAPLSLCYLVRELDPEQYESILCCHPRESTARDLLREFGYEARTWAMVRFQHSAAGWWKPWSARDWTAAVRWARGFPASCRTLGEMLASIKPDIVHLYSLTLLPYAPGISATGAKVVVHVREPAGRGLLGLRRAWLKRLARKHADAIVYICKDNRDRLTGAEARARVIYNFVDFNEFDRNLDRAAARQTLGIPTDRLVVLFTGGSSADIKGVIPLLHALARLRTMMGPIHCLMPGTIRGQARAARGVRRLLRGKLEEQKIQEAIASLGLEGVVARSTFQHNMPTYYAACDVVAVPFIKPHFSRSVIEAGAMGRPVVASRIGGVTEVVNDGVTGLLVEPNEPEILAKALARVLREPSLAQRLGEQGYVQARAMFEAGRNGPDTIAIYGTLLDR